MSFETYKESILKISDFKKELGYKKHSDKLYTALLVSGDCPVFDYHQGFLYSEVVLKEDTIEVTFKSIDDSYGYAIGTYKEENIQKVFDNLIISLNFVIKINWESYLNIFKQYGLYFTHEQ